MSTGGWIGLVVGLSIGLFLIGAALAFFLTKKNVWKTN